MFTVNVDHLWNLLIRVLYYCYASKVSTSKGTASRICRLVLVNGGLRAGTSFPAQRHTYLPFVFFFFFSKKPFHPLEMIERDYFCTTLYIIFSLLKKNPAHYELVSVF